jgi:inorganic triphosphatase YgiF
VKSLARRGDGAVHRRLELEGPAGGGDEPRRWSPSAARDRLLEAIGDASLATLAVLRQRRLQRDVGIGMSIVELSLDKIEVVRAGGESDRWVELEGELRSGAEADLAALGELLLRRADLEPATTSKLERARAVSPGMFTER